MSLVTAWCTYDELTSDEADVFTPIAEIMYGKMAGLPSSLAEEAFEDANDLLPDNEAYIDYMLDEAEPYFDDADENDDGILLWDEFYSMEKAMMEDKVEEFGEWMDFTDEEIRQWYDAIDGLGSSDGVNFSDYARAHEIFALIGEAAYSFDGDWDCSNECDAASDCGCSSGTAYYYSEFCLCCGDEASCDDSSGCACDSGTAYYYPS